MAFSYQTPLISHNPLKTYQNGRKEKNEEDLLTLSDYSVVAFLPVLVILGIVVTIGCIYQYRKWKHEKKQIDQLAWVYDTLEEVPCAPLTIEERKKEMIVDKNGETQISPSQLISRAVVVPSSESSPFFQPINKGKGLRYDNMTRATTAREVIFHFTMITNDVNSNGIVQEV